MKNSIQFLNQFNINTDYIDEETTVILGFSGYGSVGNVVLNHLIETLPVTSIGFWGSISWFHQGNLETPITIYTLDGNSTRNKGKIVLVASRLPVPVVGYNALPDTFWKWLSEEILSWKAKRYIVIGGLREDIRKTTDEEWTSLIPTPLYTELYGTQRTFKDQQTIKGPLNFLLTEGTAFQQPVLAILSYCNTYDIDIDASVLALKELEKIIGDNLHSEKLVEFDSSFLEGEMELISEGEEEFDEYDESFDEFEENSEKESSNRDKEADFFSLHSSLKRLNDKAEDLDKYK